MPSPQRGAAYLRWRKQARIGLALAVITGLSACYQEAPVGSLPDDDYAPIETDKTAYTLAFSGPDATFDLTATYVNRTNAPRYVEVCGTFQPFFGVERLTSGRWEAVEQSVGYGCASELIAHEVVPGGCFVQPFATIFLDATGAPAGRYRMIWGGVQAGPEYGSPLLPKAERVSNSFRLDDPR